MNAAERRAYTLKVLGQIAPTLGSPARLPRGPAMRRAAALAQHVESSPAAEIVAASISIRQSSNETGPQFVRRIVRSWLDEISGEKS